MMFPLSETSPALIFISQASAEGYVPLGDHVFISVPPWVHLNLTPFKILKYPSTWVGSENRSTINTRTPRISLGHPYEDTAS